MNKWWVDAWVDWWVPLPWMPARKCSQSERPRWAPFCLDHPAWPEDSYWAPGVEAPHTGAQQAEPLGAAPSRVPAGLPWGLSHSGPSVAALVISMGTGLKPSPLYHSDCCPCGTLLVPVWLCHTAARCVGGDLPSARGHRGRAWQTRGRAAEADPPALPPALSGALTSCHGPFPTSSSLRSHLPETRVICHRVLNHPKCDPAKTWSYAFGTQPLGVRDAGATSLGGGCPGSPKGLQSSSPPGPQPQEPQLDLHSPSKAAHTRRTGPLWARGRAPGHRAAWVPSRLVAASSRECEPETERTLSLCPILRGHPPPSGDTSGYS